MPSIARRTHDVTLRDSLGRTVGLKLATSRGEHDAFGFARTPVDRSALKTSSGQSSYSDYQYPYSPIVQDDWSGGRGGLDFERDTTKYNDSHRVRTGLPNAAFLGPQEQFTSGYRGHDFFAPGNVYFDKLTTTNRTVTVVAATSYTATRLWALVRKVGSPSTVPVLQLRSATNTLLYANALSVNFVQDDLSQWVYVDISYAVTAGTTYILAINESASNPSTSDYWEVGAVAPYAGNPYMQMSDAASTKTCQFFEYKRAQYAVISSTSGAPTVYLNGDRGAADSNAGNLNKLIDATKTWTTNQWVGCVVFITTGNADVEPQRWRTITANNATSLTVSPNWTIEQTTDVEYVILGSNTWRSLGACGLTAPVTSILVIRNYVCMAQGDSANIRKLQAVNTAGTWTDFDTAANQADDSTNRAVYLVWTPKGNKVYKVNNNDGASPPNVSIANATPTDWGTAMTFGSASNIGDRHTFARGVQVYPDDNGTEAVWVFKEDLPWIVPSTGSPYALSLKEMAAFRDKDNGIAALVHNVYLYFPLRVGLQRYYAGQVDDQSINNGDGLPAERRGPITAAIGYPGKFFVAYDGGSTGYSSIFDRDSGWHERYRAPKGQTIGAFGYQNIPGPLLDRLWFYEGNSIKWLPFPSDSTDERKDTTYPYTHEGNLILSRMHAGMFDVQKLCNAIKLWMENTEEGVAWIDVFYRVDDNDNWTKIVQPFDVMPTQKATFNFEYGLTFKRIQLRLRFNTVNRFKSPILLASIVEAVMRTDVKYIYKLAFVLDETDLLGRPEELSRYERLAILDEWADASSRGMLHMEASDPLYGGTTGRKIFLNPMNVQVISLENDQNGNPQRHYYCTTTAQDA